MASIWVSEFEAAPDDAKGQLVRIAGRPLASYELPYAAAEFLEAVSGKTRIIRLFADAEFHLSYDGPATTKSERFAANTEYFRSVQPGDVLSIYDGTTS